MARARPLRYARASGPILKKPKVPPPNLPTRHIHAGLLMSFDSSLPCLAQPPPLAPTAGRRGRVPTLLFPACDEGALCLFSISPFPQPKPPPGLDTIQQKHQQKHESTGLFSHGTCRRGAHIYHNQLAWVSNQLGQSGRPFGW